MYQATKDFDHLGVKVKAGQEVKPDTFTPGDIAGLIAKGLLIDLDAEPKAEAPKRATARSKTK